MSHASGKRPPTVQRRPRDPRRPRAGLSLLEVLVATVILAGSMVVLMELAAIGRRQVSRIERWSTAQRLCRTKIDEVAAGIVQAQDVDNREFDGEPDCATDPNRGNRHAGSDLRAGDGGDAASDRRR
jgi:Tfp pilus assembly protein PilV